MLETVRKYVHKRSKKTFDEKYLDYIITMQDKSILLEMEYIKTHNHLDILKLDKWIQSAFEEAV